MQELAGGPDVVGQFFAFDHVEDAQRHRTTERGAAEGGAMRARPEDLPKRNTVGLVAEPESPDGEASAQGLGHGDAVRNK